MSTAGSCNVTALVLGGTDAERGATMASLDAQSVDVHVVREGEVASPRSGDILLLIAAGTVVDFTAAERLAWFLATHPQYEWVTGGDYADAIPADATAAVMQCVAVRTERAGALLGVPVFAAAGHDGRGTPGLALRVVVALHRAGGRGGYIDAVRATTETPSAWLHEDVARAQATLRLLDVDPAALVDLRSTRPSPLPVQRLAASPASPVVKPVPSARRRALVLVQGFPMGGYTAFNADLIPRLVALGYGITTAALEWWRSDWRLDRVRAVAPDIHHVPSVVPFAYVADYVAHLIRSRRVEVVFMSHSFLGYRLLLQLRAQFPTVAFVDYVHTEWFEAGMYGSYATMSARWSSQLDAQIVSSAALGRALVRDGADPARVHVAYIGIDAAQWTRAGIDRDGIRSAFGAGDDSTVLLFAGRVSPEKRPLLAVDALERLRAEGRDVRLVVAGDGPLLRRLNDEIGARGLDPYVSLLGDVDEDTLRQVYAAADVVFAPSEIEGVARTLYEAMAMACVPVVSDVGGQRELVQAEFGALVPPGRGVVDDYLPALRRWCDPRVRGRAGVAARARIESAFESRHTLAAIDGVIERAVAAAGERRGAAEAPHAADAALAEELAVLGTEVARRHAVAVAAALDGPPARPSR